MAEKSTQHYLRSLDVNQKIISSIDNGIIILDTELRIHYFNNWLEIRTFIKEKDILDKTLESVFTNINAKTLKRKIKTALKMGTPTFYAANTSKYLIPIKINQLNISDFNHMRQDVSIIPFDADKELVALIITDQTNMINANTMLEANILKIKELYEKLRRERETIDQKVLLLKLNLKYEITNLSHAYLHLIKYETDELLTKNYFTYQEKFLSHETKTNILRHIDEKRVYKFENKTLTKTKKELILLHTLVPEYDTYANHIGFILFMENITDSKKLIIQQEKLLNTSRSAAMGEMISMIAHQWRQPLSVINTILATLRIKQELNVLNEETTEEAYDKIENTVQYLSHTIDDFREFFKPNKIIKEVYLEEIINKSTSLLLNEMNILSINYKQEIPKNAKIQTYQNELIQCMINILKNSIDAFKESKIDKQDIDLVIKDYNKAILISLTDNAGGISEKIINKVFDPYFSTKAKNGTGIGLYMTKTIIEEHLNGKIDIQSSHGSTNITIKLPYTIKKEKLDESSMS